MGRDHAAPGGVGGEVWGGTQDISANEPECGGRGHWSGHRNGLGRLWGTLSGPVPVLEPKNRQTEAGPSLCGSEKAGPQGTEARGEAPLGDSACSSLTLLSAAAKIHSLQPCLGANQPPCP